jgi:hypothetical protein
MVTQAANGSDVSSLFDSEKGSICEDIGSSSPADGTLVAVENMLVAFNKTLFQEDRMLVPVDT